MSLFAKQHHNCYNFNFQYFFLNFNIESFLTPYPVQFQRMEEYKSSPCKSRKSFVIKGDPNEMIDEGKPCVGQKRKTLGKLLRYNNAVDNLSSDEEEIEDLVEEEEEEDCEGKDRGLLNLVLLSCHKALYLYQYIILYKYILLFFLECKDAIKSEFVFFFFYPAS